MPQASLVRCVRCGRELALRDADIVGRGYRCETCSVQAELERAGSKDDLSDDLSPKEIARRRTALSRESWIGGVTLLGIVALSLVVWLVAGGWPAIITGLVAQNLCFPRWGGVGLITAIRRGFNRSRTGRA